MRRISGLKESLAGVFKSKKRGSATKRDGSPPALLPRYTALFGSAPVGSNSQPSHDEAQATDEAPQATDEAPQTTDEALAQAKPSLVNDAKHHDLWAEAYQKFEAREPELAADYTKHLNTFHQGDKADVLSNVASVEPLVHQLLADRDEKQWRIPLGEKDVKIREQVEKLIKFLLWSDPIVKKASGSQPYAAMAWSTVSILLPLISSGKVQHEAMLGGFEYISHVQMFWRIYEEENPTHESRHPNIPPALTTLYSQIVEYQARVICHLSTAQLSRAWQKMADSNVWEGRKETIVELDKRCGQLVSEVEKMKIQRQQDLQLQEMQESREILEDIRQGLKDLGSRTQLRYDDEQERTLLHHLSADYEHYKNANPLRVQGTCEWLFNDDRFHEWRGKTTSSLLWVSAGPGCGKSVLSRALIDEGRLSTVVTTSAVCYFFFQNGVDGQVDSCSALSAMLHQLFTQDSTGDLIKHAVKSHKHHGEKLKHNFAELWKTLLACASAHTSGEIICVFDALDECGNQSRHELLNALRDFFKKTNHKHSRLKFFVTSRPYDDIEAAFRRFPQSSGYIRVDGDDKSHDISQEINVVIDAQVQDFAMDLGEDHRRELSERLKAMENRTYLWLHLTFDIIKRRRSAFSKASRFRDLLNSLPSQVSDAYETILSHNTQDPEDQALTRALLQIILAASRPLMLQEANYALTLAASNTRYNSHESIVDDLWPGEIFKSVVKNLSGLFISVYDSKVSFIHLTAREFLTDTRTQREWHGRFRMDASHSIISSVCIRYLLVVDPGLLAGDDETVAREYPLVPYSSKNWSIHYKSQHHDGRQNLCNDALKLCDTSGERAKRLPRLYTQTSYLRDLLAEKTLTNCTDLTLASHLGLEPVVSRILDDRGIQSRYEDYGIALWAAAGAGQAGVTQILLKSSKIEACRKENNWALVLAIVEGHVSTMQVLLDNAAEIPHPADIPRLADISSHADADAEVEVFGGAEVAKEVLMEALIKWGKDVLAPLFERCGDIIHLDEELITMAAINANYGPEVMELLLEKRGHEIQMEEFLLKAAAGNPRFAKEVMAVLFEKRGDEIHLTEEVVSTAAGNHGGGEALMAFLLEQRGDSIPITENVLVRAARAFRKTTVLEMLLEARDDVRIITDKVVASVAGSRGQATDKLKILLEKLGTDIPITENVLKEAAGSLGCGVEMMSLLLDVGEQSGNHIPITEDVIETAAENKYCGKEVIAFLLERRGDEVRVTENAFKKAAKNRGCGAEIVSLMLDVGEQSGNHIPITEDVVMAAVGNGYCGKEIMTLLLERRGDEVCITENVFKRAAKNLRCGHDIISLLLDAGEQSGNHIPITEDVVVAAAGNSYCGKEAMMLLLERRGDEVPITEDVVIAAVKNGRYGEEIMTLLLERRGDEVRITDKVLAEAAKVMKPDKNITAFLLEKQRDIGDIKDAVVGEMQSD